MSTIPLGIFASSAAKTWTFSSALPDAATRGYSQGVAFGASNQFVMLRSTDSAPSVISDNNSLISTNGANWTQGTLPAAMRAIAGNGNIVVAFPNTGGLPWYTTDGTTWTRSTGTGNGESVRHAYWDGNKFIAVSENSTPTITTSTDGIAWTGNTSLNGSGGATGITNNGTTYLAVLRDEVLARLSTNNLVSFTGVSLGTDASWSAVAFANGVYVVIANNNTSYRTSTNGTTWTIRTLPAAPGTNGNSGALVRMGVVDGRFVYVASNTRLYESSDGINWLLRSGPQVTASTASTGFATNGNIAIASLANSDHYLIYS